ncbi:uncharacterized protein LOC131160564 [Malania oleifera]|uniref:uncharacterized protein LOC131160564 n=1 Tax=Malania oleifera TaxID=397392 RepID=UPI0025AE1CEE|nr:uncharacterized protein LOC131160564 [Malania oleifera]
MPCGSIDCNSLRRMEWFCTASFSICPTLPYRARTETSLVLLHHIVYWAAYFMRYIWYMTLLLNSDFFWLNSKFAVMWGCGPSSHYYRCRFSLVQHTSVTRMVHSQLIQILFQHICISAFDLLQE